MSAMSAGLRAVTAACQPRARTASASSRPKPVEQPVISHVCIIFPRFGFCDERARRPEFTPGGLFPAPAMRPASVRYLAQEPLAEFIDHGEFPAPSLSVVAPGLRRAPA